MSKAAKSNNRYYTLEEIGATLGISGEMVRAIEKRAIAKIRVMAVKDAVYCKKLLDALETMKELEHGNSKSSFWEAD